MARKATNLAEVKVYINGKAQAEKELKELQVASDGFASSMKMANKQMLEASEKMAKAREKTNKYSGNKNSAEYKSAVDELNQAQNDYDEAQKKFVFNEKEWKKYQRLIKESEKLTVDLETALQHLSEQDIATLKKLQRQVDAVRNRVKGEDDPNKEFLNQLNEAFNQIADTIKNKKGDLIEFSDIVKDLTNVDDTSLAKAEQRLRSLLAATDKDDVERIKQLKAELEKTVGERQRRVKVEAQDVQQQVKDNKWKGTIEETQRAIKLQEEYKQSLKTTDAKSLKAVEETIDGLNKKLEAYQKKQTTSVLKNLDDSSYTQIQAAIEHAKKLQQAAKPGSSAWNSYGKQIANATLYLEKWNDQQKRTKMVEISKQDLGKLSDEDLKQSLRYWDGMVNGIGRTNIAVEQYRKTYARFQEENAKRANKLMTSVEEGNLGDSIGQVQKNLKTLQDFRLTISPKDEEALGRVDAVIETLKQNIKETESGFMSFEDAMKKAQGIMSGTFDPTLDDLEQIQKVLKEGMQNKFHIANPEDEAQLKQTLGLMEEMLKKQKEVMRLNHQDKVDAVSGKLDKVSPAEIEEAVKAAKELQQVAKTKEEFIQLGEFIGKAEARLKDWNETSKQSVMKSQIKDLSAIRALSDSALQDQLKFWEGTMNAAKKTSTAYKEAKKNFEDLQAESKRRLQFEGEKVINDVKLGVGDGSTKQMQERLKLLQDYRAVIDGTKPDAYKAVDEAILKLTEDIKASQAGFLSFDKALERAKQVSDGTFKPTLEDLEQIQKVLKEGMQNKFNLVDDADIDQLKETRRLMDEMAKKQAEADRIRLKDQAEKILGGDYTKTIEGTKQAIELLKKYQDTLDTTNPDAINEVTKSINKMKEELESASRAKAAEIMADPMKFSADEINEAIKLTEKLQSATNNATVWEDYEQQLIKAREARDRFADDSKYKAMVKQFEDLEDLTANAWAEQKKYWEAMRDSGKHYDEAIAKLKEMQELETTRMKDSSTKTLTTDLLTAGTGDIKQSVEWLTKYQASLEPLEEEWTNINNLIKAGEERLKSITETVSKQNLSEQAGKIMGGDYTKTIEGTKQAIEILKKYQQTLDATDTKGINKVEESIKRMSDELDTVTKKNARETLTTNLKVAGTEDIKQAVEWLTKYQGTLKPLSPLWKKINKEIEAGNERLKELSDGKKMAAMTEQFKKYKDLSVNALAEQKKYWTEVKNTHAETEKEYKRAVARLEKIDELEKSHTKAEATPIITEATSGTWDKTIEETEKAIKLIQEYKKQLHTSTDATAIADADKAIEALNANLKKGKEGLMDFGDAIAKAKTISGGTFSGTLEDLEKLQKAIKEGINTKLDITSDADIDRLKEAQKLLEDIAKEQQNAARARLEEQAKDTQAQVKAGTYKGTIEETEKAIELQRQYMKLLDTTDAAGIKAVEDTIESLQQKLKQAKNELMSYEKAMAEVDKMNKGTWKGTLEDLEKIKKSLEYHKKNKLDVGGDTKGLKDIEKALREIEKTGRGAHMSMADIDKLIKNLDSASVEKLTVAAKELQDQLQDAVRGTQEYAETAAKLREVNLELKKAKKEWEGQENVITRTAKRLAAYVAVYGGFNEIMGKMKEMVNMNLQLSDSMADVQKTTGLTGVELQELGRSLERIDTRTTTAELYQLAAAAGQIGLKTQEDVLGFAKAANTISVALNELGAEGSASLMKIATLTGEVQRYGTEQALTRVGSAINELTANSAATAGPIADFISRVGGIASASKMAISEMAALGAAADASGQSIEIAGTSMNKLISAITSNTENIAYAANISVAELEGLINQGETMQAIIRVLESMEGMDRGATNELMKELGSEGARMNQYVSSMVANLDLLKRQLNISREAFDENVSVLNEYNVKQESALGILQRMKNSFMDTFVNSRMTEVLKDVLEAIAAIPGALAKLPGLLLTIKIVIAQILLFKLPFLLHNLMMQLSGLYKLLSGPVISAFKMLHVQILRTMASARSSGASINYLTAALRTLGKVIVAHPLMALASVVTAGVVAWMHFRDKVDEVTKVTNELSQKHSRQLEELASLRAALESVNTLYATRAAAMREINSIYGKYLGFELSELDNYGKKARALELINAKLKENQALELKNERQGVIRDEFKESSEGDLERMEKILTKIPEITRNRWTEALAVMNKAIQNGAETSSQVAKELDEYFDTDKVSAIINKMEGQKNSRESVYMKWYIDKYSAFLKDMKTEDDSFNNAQTQNRKETYEKQVALFEEQQKIVDNLRNDQSKRTEAEQRMYLQELQQEQKDLLAISEQLFESAKEQDFAKIEDSLGKNQMFDVEALRKNVSEATAARAEGMNELIKQRDAAKQILQETNDEVKHIESQLVKAQAKKNNEEEIKVLTDSLEEKKALRDKYGKDVQAIDEKWQDEFQSMQTKNASEVKLRWMETVASIKESIKEIQMAIEGDPFGKLLNLKSWKGFEEIINPTALKDTNAASIVGVYKKLREDYLKMSGDLEGLNKMFDFKVPMTSLEQAQAQIFSWAEQLRNELRRRGLTTTGMMIASDTQSQVDNALNKLKTHFIKRQAEIRDSFINGTISSAEMNRQIEANDQELLKARIELRKRLNNEESYFKQALYPELNDVDIQKIVNSVGTADSEVRDKLKADLEEDGNVLREGLIAIRQKIESELLAIDPFRGLDDKFQTSLDELNLMSSQFERDMAGSLRESGEEIIRDASGNIMNLDRESQRERLEFLMEMSKISYTVDANGLREMMKSHKEYYNWIGNLDDQELHLMLIKLQKFYDDALIAQENYGKRIRKSLEASYNQQGKKLGDLGKEEWILEGMIDKRNALIRETLSESYNGLKAEDKKSLKDRIEAINLEINKQEEKLADLRDKTDKENKSRKKQKEREAKEEMEASISALQAYYNEMEALIRKQGLENKWTPEDIERKVLANKIAAERDEIELRKKLLGEISAFDPNANNGYKGVITGHEFFGSNKGEKELKKQAEQIKVWGKALVDGMRNQIAKGEIEIATEAEKVREKVKKALLEGDMFGKFENDFSDMLDEIGVLTSEFEDKMNEWHTTVKNSGGPDFGISLSEDERKNRIAALTQFADEAYSLTAESLRERMAQNTIYANWVNNLNDDEMGILLQKLRGYYDDRLALTKKYQDQMKKEFDAYYQQTGKQAEYEQKKKNVELSSQQQSDLESFGVTRGVDYGAKRQSISDSFDVENQKYLDQIAKYKEQSEALTKDMVDVMREKGLGSPEYQEIYRQKEAMDQLVLDTELERNQLLAQSQRDLTQVYMDEWAKRAERWGQWGEMFGEYLGEQVMLEKQANDARARGDLETAKKIEQQQKQNKQALIQNLLSKIVDEAALWAKEYALKMMFNSLMLAEDKKKAIEEATLQGKSSMLSILLNALTGQSKEHAKGIPGLVTGAIIFAATMALQAFAKSAIANMFPEAATESTGTRRLSTGMLTYAEGNYPVLGNDGKVYDAKYEGAGMKTGVYGGGAHFGIFSEKQPEMIVDGKTTQKIILNYPYIYDAITTIAKNGRLKNAIPTFATGDYPAGMKQLAPIAEVDASTGSNEQLSMMREELAQSREVNRRLLKAIEGGITAHLDGLETHKQQKKNERFLKRRGID